MFLKPEQAHRVVQQHVGVQHKQFGRPVAACVLGAWGRCGGLLLRTDGGRTCVQLGGCCAGFRLQRGAGCGGLQWQFGLGGRACARWRVCVGRCACGVVRTRGGAAGACLGGSRLGRGTGRGVEHFAGEQGCTLGGGGRQWQGAGGSHKRRLMSQSMGRSKNDKAAWETKAALRGGAVAVCTAAFRGMSPLCMSHATTK